MDRRHKKNSVLIKKETNLPKYVTLKTITNEDINFDLIMDEDLAQNKYPKAFIDAREDDKKGKHCSLAAKIVSPEVFEELKDKQSPNGWTLARAINTGTMNPKSFVGCHAGYFLFIFL